MLNIAEDVFVYEFIFILKDVLRLCIIVLVVFLIALLYVKFKRWYLFVKIQRARDDAIVRSNYIIENGRTLSHIQKYLLDKTGMIISKFDVLFFIVCCTITMLICIGINLFGFEIVELIFNESIQNWIIANETLIRGTIFILSVLCCCVLIFFGCVKKHGRLIVVFILMCLILIVAVVFQYLEIKQLYFGIV